MLSELVETGRRCVVQIHKTLIYIKFKNLQ